MSITSSFGLLCVLMLFHSGCTERILYTITVRTGNVGGAGTNAKVFIILHGTRGSTDRIELQDTTKRKFEIGSTDTFTISAENVGPLTSITIGHDNAGWRPGWFLKDVRISQQVTPVIEYLFNWNNWIARNELNRTIVKTISVAY